MKQFGSIPLCSVILPANDCWLKMSRVTQNTLKDIQMIKDFDNSKRGGLSGIMGHRYNSSSKEPVGYIRSTEWQLR